MTQKVNIIKEIEVPSAFIKIREDGILHIEMKLRDDIEINNTHEIYEARMKLTGKKAYPHLYTGSIYLNPSNEVTAFAASEKRNKYVLADAFVINSLAQRLIGNLYMKFYKPKIPTCLFTNSDKAVEWLKQYVK